MNPTSAARLDSCTQTGAIGCAVAPTSARRWLPQFWNVVERLRAKVVKTRRKPEIQKLVRENVEVGSDLYTDSLKSYDGLDEFRHQAVDHAETYVNGRVHTNGCENFWALLKRGIHGTYISVEPFHLFRYLDE